MQRTQISLTEETRRALDAEGARTGQSLSALVRAAVDACYGSGGSLKDHLRIMQESAGSWSDDPGRSGEEWAERLRSGRRLST